MSDLLSRLDRLNARRLRLNAYIARVKMAFWMPKLQKRILFRLHNKLRHVAADRSRLLAHINADPTLRAELRAHQRKAAQSALPTISHQHNQRQSDAAARQQALNIQPKNSPPLNQPESLQNQAENLHKLRTAERLAKTAYQQAVWYYKSGQWKAQNISAEQVGQLLDTLKADYRQSANTRVAEQQSFEDAVRAHNPSDPHHIVEREKLLAAAPKTHPADDPLNAFEQWTKANTPQPNHKPSESPYKRRSRGR